MSILKKYNGVTFEEIKLNYYDGEEYLPVVTDQKQYRFKFDPNLDLTPGKTISMKLDNSDYSYTIQEGDLLDEVIEGLKSELEINSSAINLELYPGKLKPTTAIYCSDDFSGTNGDAVNELLWTPYIASPFNPSNGLIEIRNNNLFIESDRGDGASWGSARVLSSFVLSGAFSITINYNNYNTGAGNYFVISAKRISDNYVIAKGSSNNNYSGVDDLRAQIETEYNYVERPIVADMYGSITISRDLSNSITVTNSGNGVSTSKTAIGDGSDIYIEIGLSTYTSSVTLPAIEVADFTINSADAITWKDGKEYEIKGFDSIILKPKSYNFTSNGKNYPSQYLCTPDYCSDSFDGNNGDLCNPKLWEITPGTGKLITIQNNALRLEGVDVSSDYSKVTSTFAVDGDFSVEIDFKNLIDNNEYQFWNFRVDAGGMYGYISTGYYVGNKFETRIGPDIPNDNNYVSASRLNTYGKIKLERIGATLNCYYADGDGGYILFNTHSSFSIDSAKFGITYWSNNAVGNSCDFDNFIINSADSIYIDDKNLSPKGDLTINAVSTGNFKKFPHLKTFLKWINSLSQSGERTSTSSTVPVPSEAIVGDLLVLVIQAEDNATNTIPSLTLNASGWTQIVSHGGYASSTVDSSRVEIFYKIATETEVGSSITFSGTNSPTGHQGCMFAFNVDTTESYSVVPKSVQAAGGANTTATPTAQTISIDTVTNPCILFALYMNTFSGSYSTRSFTPSADLETIFTNTIYVKRKIYNSDPQETIVYASGASAGAHEFLISFLLEVVPN